ncbi:uncharacterized protein LOC108024434 isoform X2 [Drosophila biarmipes]|uniref:uncharacterized protein LOC108024434 isoform X2 n=1 Tax=Drosophila biarmipes TaxID=125945 RepID=UPI0021CCFA99|nr:uncharacterized protein LOC108024434 isoform X2 [Drosophila biarmipes]
MTSTLVLLIASVVHFGMRGTCLLDIERFPVIPGTVYAGHIAYCAILHFLHDMEILPSRYRRRMGWLAAFLVELVLGVAIMEVLALWLWCSVEHIIHLTLQLVLRRYLDMPSDVYQRWEWAIMGGLMTSLAALLWLNAYEATEPTEVAIGKSRISQAIIKRKEKEEEQQREENQQEEEQQKEEQQQEEDQPTEQEPLPCEEKPLEVLATTTDC